MHRHRATVHAVAAMRTLATAIIDISREDPEEADLILRQAISNIEASRDALRAEETDGGSDG